LYIDRLRHHQTPTIYVMIDPFSNACTSQGGLAIFLLSQLDGLRFVVGFVSHPLKLRGAPMSANGFLSR
jgi:hypothetical protein